MTLHSQRRRYTLGAVFFLVLCCVMYNILMVRHELFGIYDCNSCGKLSHHMEHINTTTYSMDPSLPKVALCAMTKDSELYLDEWVDYNLAIGFHTIHIMDNSDRFDLEHWGRARANSNTSHGKVTILHFPGERRQRSAYNQCIRLFGKLSDYMAFFDDDEFLVLRKHPNVGSLVRDHLLPDGGSLAIHWRIFGSSNHTLASNLPVTKRFQYRLKITHQNIKSIVRVKDYGKALNPHSFSLLHNTTQKDTSGSTDFSSIAHAASNRRVDDVAIVHHYKYKSAKEFNFKSCVRKDASGAQRHCNNTTESLILPGETFDDSAWQLLKSRVPKYAAFDQWTDYS
jgi:hypothetical protein